jgi:hypothetical protein
MKNEKLYHITYDVTAHPKGIKKSDLKPGGGACDTIVIGTIMNDESHISYKIMGLDGSTNKPLEDDELFKFWAILAYQLSKSEILGEGRRGLCAKVHEAVKKAVLAHSEEGEAENHD